MSFFQCPFLEEFRGNWVLGDRQYCPTYKIRPNGGRTFDKITAFGPLAGDTATGNGTYNLAGTDSNGDVAALLSIKFAYRDFTQYFTISVDIAGPVPAATKPSRIVELLNANSLFSTYFLASLQTRANNVYADQIHIDSKKPGYVKFFVENTGAEEALQFNRKAGIAQLPIYFNKHNWNGTSTDSLRSLVPLTKFITGNTAVNPTVVTSVAHGLKNGDKICIANSNSNPVIDATAAAPHTVTVLTADTFTVPVNVAVAGTKGVWAKVIDANLITNALDIQDKPLNWDLSDTEYDWQLLKGQSGIFNFRVNTVDGSDRITQTIEYSAGSVEGDFARKINYTYSGANLQPDTVTEAPYILAAADLITPP